MAKKPKIGRDQAMRGRPVVAQITAREPLPDGGERITVQGKPSRVQRVLLRLPVAVARKYELDPMGVDMLALCDGNRTVRHVIKRFAKTHQLHPAEAETAVVEFLRTLMRKGLIHMIVPKK